MKQITAKFVGTNSLGYEKGKTYTLLINQRGNKIYIERESDNREWGSGNSSVCIYNSIRGFLNNWDSIHVLKP